MDCLQKCGQHQKGSDPQAQAVHESKMCWTSSGSAYWLEASVNLQMQYKGASSRYKHGSPDRTAYQLRRCNLKIVAFCCAACCWMATSCSCELLTTCTKAHGVGKTAQMAHTPVTKGIEVSFVYGTLEPKGPEDLANLFTNRAPLPAVRPARKGIWQVRAPQKASTPTTVL